MSLEAFEPCGKGFLCSMFVCSDKQGDFYCGSVKIERHQTEESECGLGLTWILYELEK